MPTFVLIVWSGPATASFASAGVGTAAGWAVANWAGNTNAPATTAAISVFNRYALLSDMR